MANWMFNLKRNVFNWVSIRNYVVVSTSSLNIYNHPTMYANVQGPITEELVWRSCLVCAYRLAGASNAFLVFFTPVSFGSGAYLSY
jgi:hypothetical protein